MARKCAVCGKSPSVGNSVSKSKRRTKRRWLPNLQKKTIKVANSPKKVYVCTSCLKSGKVELV